MTDPKSRGQLVRKPTTSSESPDAEGIEGILSKLPKNTPHEVVEVVTQAYFSGPVPPPALLGHYEEVLPGLANRIVTMAEREQGVRHRDNKWILSNDTLRVSGSLIVSLTLIAAGVYCGLIGEPWLGGVLGTSGAISGILRQMLVKK